MVLTSLHSHHSHCSLDKCRTVATFACLVWFTCRDYADLWQRLGMDGILTVLLCNRMGWHGQVLRRRKELSKKCKDYEVKAA